MAMPTDAVLDEFGAASRISVTPGRLNGMALITAYHRPESLGGALALLHRTGTRSVILAGGTSVVPQSHPVETEVIDLQSIPMTGVEPTTDGRLGIGALTTLSDLASSPNTPAVVAEAARREQPSTLRSLATVGGTVVSNSHESELLAALLAFDATVTFANPAGSQTRPLDDVVADPSVIHGAIVTGIAIETSGPAAAARTARTPQDTPIVAVVARQTVKGTTIAASGVAHSVRLVSNASELDPPGDFRGSGEYRKHVAAELIARVTKAVTQ